VCPGRLAAPESGITAFRSLFRSVNSGQALSEVEWMTPYFACLLTSPRSQAPPTPVILSAAKNLYTLRFDAHSVTHKRQRWETLHCVQGDTIRDRLT
jgi:hypothetical protein